MIRVLAVVLYLFAPAAWAVGADEPLADTRMEEAARDIMKDLRCLVCQNQSIEDSNAELARDLRVIVREQVAAGKQRAEIMDFMVVRYGDWVLMRPPVKSDTVVLWAAPGVLLLMGLGIAALVLRRRRGAPEIAVPAELSEDERAELDRLLK